MSIKPKPLDGSSNAERRRKHNLSIPKPADTAMGGAPGVRKRTQADTERRRSYPGGRGRK